MAPHTVVEIDITPPRWPMASREAIGRCVAAAVFECPVSKVVATRQQLVVSISADEGLRTLDDVKAMRNKLVALMATERDWMRDGNAA